MKSDQKATGAEFECMFEGDADPMDQVGPIDLILGVRQTLGRHAKVFLGTYGEDQFAAGKALPPEATMEVRGLIAVMLTAAENLGLAIGKLRAHHPRR
jgi:hypothetical protein